MNFSESAKNASVCRTGFFKERDCLDDTSNHMRLMKNSPHRIKTTAGWLIRISGVTAVLLGASIVVHAEDLKAGMNFLQARKLLIRDGWHPLKSQPPYGGYVGIENILIKSGVNEVESCSMDSALCIFHYKKKIRCLEVTTKGEAVKSMEIYSFSHSCST